MNKAPVNSLNLEMLLDLKKNLNAALENKCKGVILTSVSPLLCVKDGCIKPMLYAR